MKKIIFYSILTFVFCACQAGKETAKNGNIITDERPVTTEQINIDLVESSNEKFPEMPITGMAVNQKGGAVLISNETHYWIEDLDSWSANYLDKTVKVWGEIIIRYDAPVFMDTSEIVSQGIPVYSEEEMKAQSKKFWIVKAKYELFKP